MVKRIILMLTVAAMLVVAMTVSAAPVFACGHHGNGHPQCNQAGGGGGGGGFPGHSGPGNS